MVLRILIVLSSSFVIMVSSISNGTSADPHSHPWLLNLQIVNGGPEVEQCGASLIRVPYLENASDIAITAAHCLNKSHGGLNIDSGYFTYVIASDHDLEANDTGETLALVIECVIHENFTTERQKYDIAVLKLIPPIKFSETIQPIQMPGDGEEIPFGADCHVAGWGFTGYETLSNGSLVPKNSRYLQETTVSIGAPFCDLIDQLGADHPENPEWLSKFVLVCQAVTGAVDPALLLHNIAFLSSGNPQKGDSGTALVCARYGDHSPRLYGIAKSGTPFAFADVQCTYYVKVSAFTHWIRDQIKQLRQWELAGKWLTMSLSYYDMFVCCSLALCISFVLFKCISWGHLRVRREIRQVKFLYVRMKDE